METLIPIFESNPAVGIAVFLVFFVLFILAISLFLSLVSGWASLASEFRGNAPGDATTFRFVSGWLGLSAFPVSYSNILVVSVSPGGLGLRLPLMFRAFSPELFIPWRHVDSVAERRLFWLFKHAVVRFRGKWPALGVYGSAGRAVLAAAAASRGR
jgi:hypothetical protein